MTSRSPFLTSALIALLATACSPQLPMIQPAAVPVAPPAPTAAQVVAPVVPTANVRTISGSVIVGDAPVADAAVTLASATGTRAGSIVRTDAAGRFTAALDATVQPGTVLRVTARKGDVELYAVVQAPAATSSLSVQAADKKSDSVQVDVGTTIAVKLLWPKLLEVMGSQGNSPKSLLRIMTAMALLFDLANTINMALIGDIQDQRLQKASDKAKGNPTIQNLDALSVDVVLSGAITSKIVTVVETMNHQVIAGIQDGGALIAPQPFVLGTLRLEAPTLHQVGPDTIGMRYQGQTTEVKASAAAMGSPAIVAAIQQSDTTLRNAAAAAQAASGGGGGSSSAAAPAPVVVVPAPTLTGVSPSAGPTGGSTSVTITGTNLTGATAVTFGGTAATSFTVDSATQITATTPAGSVGAQNVVVTAPGGSVTSTGGYAYVAAPTVTSLNTTAGPLAGGTSVVVTGTNFTGASAVTFGGTAATAFTVNTATQITATAPAGTAGAKNLVVTTPGGNGTGTGIYTYAAAPTITAINPNSGTVNGAETIQITGANLNFAGAVGVTFDGVAGTSVTLDSPTQISVTTPANAVGGAKNVVVTAPGGSVTSVGGYTYLDPPTITGINPNQGSVNGGETIAITGTKFNYPVGSITVTIGGVAGTSITLNNAGGTEIGVTTPANAVAGLKNVVVTTPGGSVTLPNGYEYQP